MNFWIYEYILTYLVIQLFEIFRVKFKHLWESQFLQINVEMFRKFVHMGLEIMALKCTDVWKIQL